MKSNKVILYCEFCNWKIVCDFDKIDLIRIKNDSISSEKYRCPDCGRAITPKPTKDPEQELQNKLKEDKLKKENDSWIKENIEYQIQFKGIKNDIDK